MKNLYALVTFFIFSIAFGQNPVDIDFSYNMNYEDYFYDPNYKNINDFAIQPDGKIILVGKLQMKNHHHKVDSNVRSVIRLNSDMTYDNTFNSGTGFNNNVKKVVVQSNGKIIVTGDFTTYNGIPVSKIARLNPDGTLDSTFIIIDSLQYITVGPDGDIINEFGILNVKLDALDNIYLSVNLIGVSTGEPTPKLKKYNSNGVFLGEYFSTTDSVSLASIFRLSDFCINNDGSILVCELRSLISVSSTRYIIKKLNTDLTVNSTFNSNTGLVTNSSTLDEGAKLHINTDGKILVVGDFSEYNGVPVTDVVKLNEDGTLNAAFNINLYNSSTAAFRIKSIVEQSDGKIIITGLITNGIIRINTDGSIDNSFKAKSFSGFVKQNTSKLYFGFNNIDSSVSPWFNGKKVQPFFSTDLDGKYDVKDLAIDVRNMIRKSSNEYILTNIDAANYNYLKVVDGNGNDITQNYPNIYNVDFTNQYVNTSFIPKVFVQNNGKIIITHSNAGLAKRYNSDFSLDTSYLSTVPFTSPVYFQTDDKIITLNSGTLIRVNADGTQDTSFITNGFTNISNYYVQPDDKILVSWKLSNVYKISGLNSDGSLDSSFNIYNGFSSTSGGSFFTQPDGKILLCSNQMQTPNGLKNMIRLHSDGAFDNTFNYIGNQSIIVGLQNDGRIVTNNPLTRINYDGTIDQTFVVTNFAGIPYVYDNRIFLGSYVAVYKGQYASALFRLVGGDGYLLKGNIKFDSNNNNGCDIADLLSKKVKLKIDNGSFVNSYFKDESNYEYRINLTQGNYIVTPEIEHPNYFNITPSVTNVSLTPVNNVVTEDYCITYNGIHPDLEVVLLPITIARPGFDANYKLVYKNKGNQVLSGSVSLNYNDSVLDFVSALPVSSTSATGIRTWNYSNLSPFETREIALKLNLNSPVETPPLNGGSVLNYTATIISAQTDDTPNDNTFVLNQTVVNSYDPNDKSCLQGTTVGIDKVGEYVHYVIRFENTGTYAAQNITVKDVIDTDKFDINTLIPLSGSHLFTTKITEGNKVEFYFENINLPFTDATNDGYLVFKIKTKSTLVSGDTFGGLANIFFDYNSAIATNTYTTTILALSIKDFSFDNYFSLYPNPVSDILNIDKKEDIEISSIHVYNFMGQLMMVVPNAKNVSTLDVSNLSSGNYFVKINSDKGTSNTKFIKR